VSRRPIYKSEAQANAEALARRGRSYSEASGQSFRVRWDWHNREPKDLRECVRMVRAAYADEVPLRMHNQDIAEDGTPKMTPQAEGYIFGSPVAGDSAKGDDPLVDYYRAPFRAALETLDRVNAKHAAVVSHVTVGSQSPIQAAVSEGVPPWCAGIVVEHVLRSFLRNLTDIKVHLPSEHAAA